VIMWHFVLASLLVTLTQVVGQTDILVDFTKLLRVQDICPAYVMKNEWGLRQRRWNNSKITYLRSSRSKILMIKINKCEMRDE